MATGTHDVRTMPGARQAAAAVETSLETVGRLARRGRRVRVPVQRGTLALTLVAVILGIYLAAQWQSRPRPTTAPEYRREVATATIERLEAEQAELKRRIADLRGHLTAGQQATVDNRSDLGRLTSELEQAQLIAGTLPVRGPGLRIVLDDSALNTIPAKEDPAMYIVHEYQLRDIVNVLWSVGAEAISINDERIVSPTSIYCVGSTILINDTRMSPPFDFLVIGDPARLESALSDANQLRALKSRIKVYGLQFGVQKQREILLPAYTGHLNVRHVTSVTGASEDRLSSTAGAGQ